MRNTEIAKEFYEVADLMEIKGLNPFRIRAYRNAARIVENLPHPVLEMVEHGTKLDDLPGIGKDLAEKIVFTAKQGAFPDKKQVEKGIPRGVLELMKIPSLGPKRVALLCKKLRIHSLGDLERSCRKELVREIRGFGEKTEKRILDEICKLKVVLPSRMKLRDAEQLAAILKKHVETIPGIDQVVIAGSFRRRKETVGDLDIVVTGHDDSAEIMKQILAFEGAKQILSKGETRGT
ncbi:MAG: helix-hairpin-helix domain-containing protein, partial [Bdellovibrionales bacterium]